MDELTAVLSHEANHVFFEHVFHEAEFGENEKARIIAEETVVNDWALPDLPGEPYLTKNYPMVSAVGGTSFKPPFERGFLREHRPDLVVYFTDGQGPAPECPPSVPVIWCLTQGGRMPVEWGREVRMS